MIHVDSVWSTVYVVITDGHRALSLRPLFLQNTNKKIKQTCNNNKKFI
jgi:hypothetical protein